MDILKGTYYSDIFLSIVVIFGALILCKLLSAHLNKKSSKRTRTVLVLILVLILVISILLEIWKDKSDFINEVALYKHFLPGYDTIILIIAAAVFSHFLQIWLQRKSYDYKNDLSKRHQIKLIARWVSWAIFFISTGIIILIQRGWGNAGTFLGLIGAGLALSLQETLLCIIGWMYIIFNRTYEIGDRIEINGKLGDVIGITSSHTKLLEVSMSIQGGQSTGRILSVPNSQVFRNPVFNSTHGFPFIWTEVSIVITFESDYDLAIETILDVAKRSPLKIEPEVMQDILDMQEEYAIHYRHLTPTVYSRIVDNGIKLTLRFLSPVRACRKREHDMSLGILKAINDIDHIEIAYPTSRIFRRTEELDTEFQSKTKH